MLIFYFLISDKIEDSLVNRGLDENEMDMEDEEGEASQTKERYEQNKFFEKLMVNTFLKN